MLVNVPSCHHYVKLGDSCQHSQELWEWEDGRRKVYVSVAPLESYRLEIMTSAFAIHAQAARAALLHPDAP